ncbi:hypothetical protein HPSNAG_0121 [Glaesserella parasuis str. Nagasaki]|nr:hypothetical protein HPSNAG_0121 [Glaesserella parasuis str. Nagasaki]
MLNHCYILYFQTLAKWAVFVHISKRGLKALYYKALSHFLATNLSITHFLPNQTACCMDYLSNFSPSITLIRYFIYQYKR